MNIASPNTSGTVTTATPRSGLSGVCALVLLAGSVREHPLVRVTKRPVLELPIARSYSVWDGWLSRTSEFRVACGRRDLPLLVATNQAIEPLRALASRAPGTEVIADNEDIRGTGGALADIAGRFADGAFLLVSHANAILLAPLADLAQNLTAFGADIALLAGPKRAPEGIMLVRCGALRGISARGFVDFKEQALPQIARDRNVRVAYSASPAAARISDLPTYLHAIRCHHDPAEASHETAPAESFQPHGFSVIEDGTTVDPSAKLHDAVVLRGSSVGPGSIIVRSVVAGNRNIPANAVVVDEPSTARGT